MQPEVDRWTKKRNDLERKIEVKTIAGGRRRNKTVVANLKTNQSSSKRRLDQYQVQKYLDLEASQLQKNLRFVAACVIQVYCSNYVRKKFPYLSKLIKENNAKREIRERHALVRNQSNKAYHLRRFMRAKQAASRFRVLPVIVRMQRDWREYLKIKHSKREIEAAVRLLKRMRENAKNGAEFFKELKDEHRREILVAVDYNVMLRDRFVRKHFAAFREWSDARLRRKKSLYDKILRRKVNIIEIWFEEIMVMKRNYVNSVKPVMFPPLLAEYVRYTRTNDWEKLLTEISNLYCEFDKSSRVSSLKFEAHTTNKVIGFKAKITELNEMLSYHITENQYLRKKPVFVVNKDEAQMSLAFWIFLHSCSNFLWRQSRDLMKINSKLSREEEKGVVDGLLWNVLLRANLNPPMLSEKFRCKSTNFLRWRNEEELCKKCVAILPKSGECSGCGSKQLPRFMRKTEAKHSSTPESGGVRDYQDGSKYARSLRGFSKFAEEPNVITSVEDIKDAIDLFVIQCQMSCLALVGGWRRSHNVNEVWWYSVRTCGENIHRLKRRGILTIGDLSNAMNGRFDQSLDKLMGGDDNRQLINKVSAKATTSWETVKLTVVALSLSLSFMHARLQVKSMLKLMQQSLDECLREEGANKSPQGKDGESGSVVDGSSSCGFSKSRLFMNVRTDSGGVGSSSENNGYRPKTR